MIQSRVGRLIQLLTVYSVDLLHREFFSRMTLSESRKTVIQCLRLSLTNNHNDSLSSQYKHAKSAAKPISRKLLRVMATTDSNYVNFRKPITDKVDNLDNLDRIVFINRTFTANLNKG